MRIDWWTLALQTVNVLVLVWILGRFFFRPVADIVAKRREATGRLLADAAASRTEAAALKAEAEQARDAIRADRDRLMAEAQQAAGAEKARLLAQSAEDLARQHGEAQAAIAREEAAAAKALVAEAGKLSVDIARRLLARLPAGVAFAAFLDGLCGELRALPAEARQNLAGADAAQPLEVVTAVPLSADETATVRQALSDALGAAPPFAFRTDPDLIAGVELRGRNTVVRNNWQADLARIAAELERDGPPRQS